jgi:hypothetical protein
VDGCWNVKSSSSILTAVGRVVSKCSKVLSDWERGMIVGSCCGYICKSVGWQISGYYCCVGAGRASTLGDDSISVSLTGSAAGRAAICLVYTICSSRETRVVRRKMDLGLVAICIYDKSSLYIICI